MERKDVTANGPLGEGRSTPGRARLRAPARSVEVTTPRLDDRLLDGLVDPEPVELPREEPEVAKADAEAPPLPAPPEEALPPSDPLRELRGPGRRTVTAHGASELLDEARAADPTDRPPRRVPTGETAVASPLGREGRADPGPGPQMEPREPAHTNPWQRPSTQPAVVDLPPDARLVAQRYKIEEEIASGGMSRIFRVTHLGMGREFALKIINADLAADPRMRSYFTREAQVLSRMEHPNIVQITDFGVDDALGAYIVMELLRGETLLDRLRREGRIALSLALDLATQVADAISYIHERDLVHCDIKAENILLCQPPAAQRQRLVVKLIDFGLSRTKALGAQLNRAEVGGTPQYMAPEQIRGEAPAPSMDIYALGVLLYEVIAGRLPFNGDVRHVLSSHLNDAPPPPSRFSREPLDEALEAVILRALAKEPAARQPTMKRFLYELRTVIDMLGLGRQRSGSLTGLHAMPVPPVAPHTHCQLCPFPMFRLDLQGRIVMSNPAFARFVKDEVEALFGRAVAETRLSRIYPELPAEMERVAREGATIQRVLTFRPAGRAPVTVLCTLVPEREEGGKTRSIIGIVVPIETDRVKVEEIG